MSEKKSNRMKTNFIWLILLACLQCPAQTDLRIIQTASGPRLYDFTTAGPAFYLSGEHLQFVHAFTNSAIFEGISSYDVFVPQILRPIPGDSGDFLRAIAQLQMAQDPTLKRGFWWAMGVDGNYEQRSTNFQICILHPPNNLPPHYFALPRFSGIWDYGIPFNGDPYNFIGIYKIVGNKVIYNPNPNSFFAVTNDLQHASNSVAYYQFKVSQRYLNGQGVKTNHDLAIYWAILAASNSYPEAIKFLSQPAHTP